MELPKRCKTKLFDLPNESYSELIGSLKLGNVSVFVQLIHWPRRTKNQLSKTQILPTLRLPISSGHTVILILTYMSVSFIYKFPQITDIPRPWNVSFSFGRALQASALKAWGGKDSQVRISEPNTLSFTF